MFGPLPALPLRQAAFSAGRARVWLLLLPWKGVTCGFVGGACSWLGREVTRCANWLGVSRQLPWKREVRSRGFKNQAASRGWRGREGWVAGGSGQRGLALFRSATCYLLRVDVVVGP